MCLFFSNNLVSLVFELVQDNLQHKSWTTDKADGFIVPAELLLAFLRECNS